MPVSLIRAVGSKGVRAPAPWANLASVSPGNGVTWGEMTGLSLVLALAVVQPPQAPRPQRAHASPQPATVVPAGKPLVVSPGSPSDHAIFVQTRLLWLPSFALSPFLSSYSNALCRAKPGPVARKLGVNRSDTCNGIIEAGYRYFRENRAFDVALGYWRLHMPDSNWLADREDVASADLTQIDLHLISLQVGMSRNWRFPRRLSRWSWRMSGQLGLALALGGVYRTKLGEQEPTCTLQALGNLSKCRPFRAVEFAEPERDPRYYARCTERGCNAYDLERAGRARDEVPRIFPTFSFQTGPRYELSRFVHVTSDIGISLGLTFGIGLEVRVPVGMVGM